MTARTCVLTGSASGIGAATSARLAAAGYRVITVDLHDADLTADLASVAGRAAMVDGITEACGGHVDAVIACAGVAGDDPLVVRVDYFGAVATLDGCRPLLARSDTPRAVAVTSVALLQAQPDDPIIAACLDGDEDRAVAAAEGRGPAVYAAAKRALSRWVRREAPTAPWAGAGIALNAVAPGIVRTPMTAGLLADETWRHIADEAVPMPLGGHADPDDIAAVLTWMVSEDNRKMTGQVVFVDGGAHATSCPGDVWPATG